MLIHLAVCIGYHQDLVLIADVAGKRDLLAPGIAGACLQRTVIGKAADRRADPGLAEFTQKDAIYPGAVGVALALVAHGPADVDGRSFGRVIRGHNIGDDQIRRCGELHFDGARDPIVVVGVDELEGPSGLYV